MIILAWHFVGDALRDGRPVPADGEWLEHNGPLVMCESGLHASERIIDALKYAPGATICRVELDGEMLNYNDKLVARRRMIMWRIDGDEVLRAFARRVALDVAHLWDMPDVVRQYLETGDESLRAAAWAAAWAAAGAAAGPAAGDAAGDAAWAAAWAAAGAAAWDAARAAAGTAAWAAAWAARAAAQDKYNAWLTEMVEAAHNATEER
jgi:hypothetical protein